MSATRRPSTSRRTTGRRTTRRTTAYPRRRRTRSVSSTVGAALGTLVVGVLLNLSWPVKIGLVVLVVLVGVAYLLWTHRAEIAAGAAADQAGAPPESAPSPQDQTPPTGGSPA